MSIGILDGIIIILFMLGIIYGTKKGFLHGIIAFIGLAVIVSLSFLFRGIVGDVLLKGMPFFKLHGAYKGITSLNILLYEALAFILVFLFLLSILSLVLKITGILQKLIDASIVLTLPSKILGVLVGLINTLIVVFIMLFVMVNLNSTRKYVYDSKIATFIMERTFILSKTTDKYYLSAEEINRVIEECKDEKNKHVCNVVVTNTLIKFDVVSKEKVIELIDSNKLKNISKKELLWLDI